MDLFRVRAFDQRLYRAAVRVSRRVQIDHLNAEVAQLFEKRFVLLLIARPHGIYHDRVRKVAKFGEFLEIVLHIHRNHHAKSIEF